MEQFSKADKKWRLSLSQCVRWLMSVLLLMTLLSGIAQSAPGGYDHSRSNSNSSRQSGMMSDERSNGGRGERERERLSSGHKERHINARETLVETSTGKLRGLHRKVLGKEVYVYLGVPFAEKPLDDLRFKKPVQNKPWEGIYNAVNPPNSCYQETYNSFPDFIGEQQWNPNTNISEDCLYLNLWVPKSGMKPVPKKLPILVWIYGGGYMSGTITLDIYNADILAAETEVIVAAINYRVGAFGFLYSAHEDAPGNQGMYDQVLALEWLKKNAEIFGGDPNNLVLFGESAGGGAVSFHMLSPISRHLIHRGILQSGTINAPWSVMEGETAKQMGRELITDLGCNGTRIEEEIQCMRGKPASEISVTQWNSYKSILAFPYAPTIDGVFLPRHPLDMLKEGDFKHDTELLIGSNKNEGTYFILYDFLTYFNKDTAACIPREKFLEIIDSIFPDRSPLEKQAILFQYTNWDYTRDDCKNADMVGEVVADYFFICPTNLFAQYFSGHGLNIYYYFFTHRTSSNPWGPWMGVMHADEIEYVFGHPLNNSQAHTLEEQRLSREIMGYFTRFAKTGKPTENDVDWPRYTKNDPTYFILNAGEEGGTKGRGPRSHACAFWNEFMPLIKPGTNSLPSKCGKERWDINLASAFSHQPKNLLNIILAYNLLVAVNILYQYSKSSFYSSSSFLIFNQSPG